ncbi:MAG: TrkA family potassium uptake protein [Planctomycetales bacterium]|nr:TrkA family potassium uptake protein [Planctomycetales bacterium]
MAESKKQHYIIIGMGSFGAALARRLSSHGARITGLDGDREKIGDLSDVLYEPVIGDATERSTLEHLALADATAVIISLGEDITQSLLATLHCRDLGAKRIIVKGVTREHGQILKSLGVSRVIFPEAEIAEALADRLIRPNIVDFLPIDPEYSFVEIAVPDTLIGKTLQEVDIRKRFSVWVVGVKDALSGQLEMFPGGDYKLGIDQLLLVIGKQSAVDAMRDLG